MPEIKSQSFSPAVRALSLTRRGELKLLEADILNAQNESRWIFEHVLREMAPLCGGLDDESKEISPDFIKRYDGLISERCRRIPLAYILGSQPFLALDIEVGPSVLIPRSETEILARAIIEEMSPRANARILEIGTGSGCIAVALAVSCPAAEIMATDVSEPAISVAQKNAMLNHAGRIQFVQSELFLGLRHYGKFDAIVSNLPYIKTGDLPGLEPEIQFEPRLALDGGPDGLALIKPLVMESSKFLNPGGRLALEVGLGQAQAVQEWMRSAGYQKIQIIKDAQEIDRVVTGVLMEIHG